MIDKIKSDADTKMHKSIESLKHDLSRLRTGRAHPSILEGVTVEYYGTPTPLNQLASVSVSDSRTLSVTPYDKNALAAIDKAIRNSELGLNPSNSGVMLRVPLPALTEESRKALVKQVKSSAEDARVAIRNVRRDANNAIKALLKDKTITEDDEKRAQDTVQKLTDKFIADVDKMAQEKEAELLHI